MVSPQPTIYQKEQSNIEEALEFSKLKELIESAIGKLDETGRSEKTEKRIEHLRADLRQAVLLAGTKNAKLNAAQDKMIQLGESLQQFYTEISGGDENAVARRQVNEIIQRLRGISESHCEKEKNPRCAAQCGLNQLSASLQTSISASGTRRPVR